MDLSDYTVWSMDLHLACSICGTSFGTRDPIILDEFDHLLDFGEPEFVGFCHPECFENEHLCVGGT